MGDALKFQKGKHDLKEKNLNYEAGDVKRRHHVVDCRKCSVLRSGTTSAQGRPTNTQKAEAAAQVLQLSFEQLR